MEVKYQEENDLSMIEFRQVLIDSTLGERRPVDDEKRLSKMVKNADMIFTARINDELIGVARSISDHAYCTYLSDLAVSKNWQKRGIGKELIRRTLEAAPTSKVILLAAPEAEEYYPKIGMTRFTQAYLLSDTSKIK